MKFNIHTREYSCDMELTGKFNVIVGLSGSGKSHLLHIIEDIRSNPKLSKDLPYKTNTSLRSWSDIVYFEKEESRLLVIDEDVIDDGLRRSIKAMIQSPHVYILISRELNSNVPYGIDNVFEIQKHDNKYRMVRKYDNKYLLTNRVSSASGIICEDSGTGFFVTNKLFGADTDVISAEGKDKIYEHINKLPEHQVVLFDNCGIGSTIKLLVKSKLERGAILYDTKSFEYEILNSLFSEVFKEYTEDVWIRGISEEDYYRECLNKVLQTLYKVDYSKVSEELAKLFVEGQCTYGNKYCNLNAFGIDNSKLYEGLRTCVFANKNKLKSKLSNMNLFEE